MERRRHVIGDSAMEISEPHNLVFYSSESKESLPFNDVSHSNDILSVFQCMRSNEELCDAVLIVGNSRILAHRVILAASSPYFRAMFTGGLMETELKEIQLHIHEENAFHLIINYIYTSKLEIGDNNVQELVSLAGLLQLEKVRQACCDYIKRKISVENCLGITAFAESHFCPQLYQCAHSYAVQHFVDVVQSDEFQNITFEHLTKIICEDTLNVHTEERVFEAVIAWVKHNDERIQFAAELMKHCRFSLLSPEFLMERVAKEEIIRNSRDCSDLMLEAVRFLLLPERRSLISRISPRKTTSSHQVLYAVGGMSRREATKSAERYDPKEGRWKPIGDMNICRFGAAMSSLGCNLYICGGSDDASRLNTVERYDVFNNAWIPIASMSSKRNGVGVVACAGKIYAVGGFDGSAPLNSVECYDPKIGKWSYVSSMNQARFGVGCCTLNDEIFAVGGSDGSNLRSCEKYSPDTNKWVEIAPMSVARKQVACAAVGAYVYAVGGSDVYAVSGADSARYSNVERYDPVVDEWMTVAPLSSPRSGAGVGVLDGFLYVCGGFDGNQYLNTVERYDPLTNQWHIGPQMNFARDCVSVCVALFKKHKRLADFGLTAKSPSPSTT